MYLLLELQIVFQAIGESGATVTGDGIKNLNPGDNTFEINVTAQDGITSNKYTINIRRKLILLAIASIFTFSTSVGTVKV